eukprot:m.17569 g.17569  ORF g.17569 m.17569 type:complete len:142 (-) comp7160_c0_seq1:41-466(-)
MADIKVCAIPQEIKDMCKKFRFRKEKNNAAIIMKVDHEKMEVVLDEELEDITIDQLAADLPEFSPRYILYSYCHTHGDGRVSYPLLFIAYCPSGVKPEQNMIYAGTKPALVSAVQATKVFEMQNAEDMTEEWLVTKLGFFR